MRICAAEKENHLFVIYIHIFDIIDRLYLKSQRRAFPGRNFLPGGSRPPDPLNPYPQPELGLRANRPRDRVVLKKSAI